MRILVTYEEQCVYNEREPEQYGSWSEDYSSSIVGVCKAAEDTRSGYDSDVYVIADGSTHAYVVYFIYSTGDSFGCADGRIDVVLCTGSETVAWQVVEQIKKNPDTETIKFDDEFGRSISISNVGAGYFESISSVVVVTTDLNTGVRTESTAI